MLTRQPHEVVIANLGPYTRCKIQTLHLSLPLTLTFFNTRPIGNLGIWFGDVEFGSRPPAFCSSCRQDTWIFILRGYQASRCSMICRTKSIYKPKAGLPPSEPLRAAVIFSAISSPGQRSSYIVAFLLVTSSILYASAGQRHIWSSHLVVGVLCPIKSWHMCLPRTPARPVETLTTCLQAGWITFCQRRDPPSFYKANDRHPWNGILTSTMTWEKYEKLTLCYEGYISDRWHFRNGHRLRI